MLFGRKDFSPSVNQQILISFELLLFFLEASCHGDKPALEMLLLKGILWYDEFVVPKDPSSKSIFNTGLCSRQEASRKNSNSLKLIKIG